MATDFEVIVQINRSQAPESLPSDSQRLALELDKHAGQKENLLDVDRDTK